MFHTLPQTTPPTLFHTLRRGVNPSCKVAHGHLINLGALINLRASLFTCTAFLNLSRRAAFACILLVPSGGLIISGVGGVLAIDCFLCFRSSQWSPGGKSEDLAHYCDAHGSYAGA